MDQEKTTTKRKIINAVPQIPILGAVIKGAIHTTKYINFGTKDQKVLQNKELRKILKKASNTAFGEHYDFSSILNADDIATEFARRVPIFDYDKMHNEWWYRTMLGETFVSWPGKTDHFALSSGTSGAPSKYIPITKDILKSIKKTSIRQLLAIANYDLPANVFTKSALAIGGSTHLQFNGTYYSGDLSGITTGNIPFWFQHTFKPGNKIARERDWPTKLEEMVKKAPDWDVFAIVGVPAWHTILMEKIIERYNLKTIHDIWPNLCIFCHGGVALTPYMKGFEKLFGKPVKYMETYLASEGFIACQMSENAKGMQMVLDLGIYYEFIPFNDDNFEDGEVKPNAQAITIDQIEEGVEYALLLTSVAGAYRYMIGTYRKECQSTCAHIF